MPLGTDRLLRPGGGGGGGFEGGNFFKRTLLEGGVNFLLCTKIRKVRGVKF